MGANQKFAPISLTGTHSHQISAELQLLWPAFWTVPMGLFPYARVLGPSAVAD